MPRPLSDASQAVILAAVRDAINATSLRKVSTDIGLSPTGLQKLLAAGGTKWATTHVKLRSWYVRHAGEKGTTDEATARAALKVLLAGVPEGDRQEAAVRAILATLTKAHGGADAVPTWLRRLHESGP